MFILTFLLQTVLHITESYKHGKYNEVKISNMDNNMYACVCTR